MSEIERALFALGRELEVPPSPELAGEVLARLEPRRRRVERRRWVAAVALAALAALAATLAIPEARSALFRVLHIGSERIERVDRLPPVGPATPGLDLDAALGRQISLEEARRLAGFPLRELEEEPDRVYLGARGTVWFLYGTPRRVRLLVAQTRRLTVEAPLVHKLAGPGTVVEEVSVDGAEGYFLSGEPHLVLLLDEAGSLVEESVWLAGNVLVWEEDGVTLRLEGDLTEERALRVAESLR